MLKWKNLHVGLLMQTDMTYTIVIDFRLIDKCLRVIG